MSRTTKLTTTVSCFALMLSLVAAVHAEPATAEAVTAPESVAPVEAIEIDAAEVEVAPLEEPIRITGIDPNEVVAPPPAPVVMTQELPAIPVQGMPDADYRPLGPESSGPVPTTSSFMAPMPSYRPGMPPIPGNEARNWRPSNPWSMASPMSSHARDSMKEAMTGPLNGPLNGPLAGVIPNMDRHRGLGGVMALPEQSMPSFNIPGFMRVWKMDLTEAQRKSLKEVYKGLRRINHSLSGELMDAVDAIQELYELPQPEPKSVGKAYGRYFDIQRRWIEAQIAAANRVEDLTTQALTTQALTTQALTTQALSNQPQVDEIPVPENAMDLQEATVNPSAPAAPEQGAP